MIKLEDYFEHIKGKTFIDKYPTQIIRLDDLRDGILIELGGGIGNDMQFLLNEGFDPEKLFFIESNKEVYNKAKKSLKKDSRSSDLHLLNLDARHTGLKNRIANFVYANNMLHCLKSEDNIMAVLEESYRLLNSNGVLFGRTLLDTIDENNLRIVETNLQTEEYRFAYKTAKSLQDGSLVGLKLEKLENMGRKVGFSNRYLEIIPTSWAPTKDMYFKFKK